ncbi:MAG: hypothetical protein H6Q37_491, partial [Chloroflexi bacterium]|nr:hypothetical protein [Chloroflexota bacterium]
QGRLLDLIAFFEIDGARSLCFQPGIEETLRICQGGAFEKVELEMIFESGGGHDIPILRPDGGIPLPARSDFRSGSWHHYRSDLCVGCSTWVVAHFHAW